MNNFFFKSFKINYILILIIFSLCLSIINAKDNLKKFDANHVDSDGNLYHQMIKNDALRYFSHGYEIKKDLKNGKNYFETGRKHFTKYLFPRIIAAYYFFFDKDLFENNEIERIKIGDHDNYLFIQSLIYYLSVIYLYTQIKERYSNRKIFFVIGFLCLEPTIFQYHGTFWSETIFFSIQILLLGLVLNNTKKNTRYFAIGVALGLMALQRTPGFFYILIIIFYFYWSMGKEFNKKISLIIIPYLFIIFFTGYHNLIRSNKFYFMPSEVKAVAHAYIINKVLNENEFNQEKIKTLNWIKDNNFKINYKDIEGINYSRYAFRFCEDSHSKKENEDYFQICSYLKDRSIKIISQNIFPTVIYVCKRSIHFIILNPFHIFTDHKFNSGKKYYESKLKDKLIPYRIIYSLFLYLICITGLISIYRNKSKEKNMLFLILFSILYYFLILSWHGNSRYFVPNLIYMSFLFSYGLDKILDSISLKFNNKNINILK